MNRPKKGVNWPRKAIFTGDNLDIMRGMNSSSVDLIYLDPPFNSKRDYEAPVGTPAEGTGFKDTWTLTEIDLADIDLLKAKAPDVWRLIQIARTKAEKSYLAFMAPRLMEMERLLKDTGAIWLHCDSHMSHYLKLLMDMVFGYTCFRNHVTWQRTKGNKSVKGKLPNNTDHILFYAKPGFELKPVYLPLDPDYVAKNYRHDDGDGRGPYRLSDIRDPSGNPNACYRWKGYEPPAKGWCYSKASMKKLHDDGRLHYPVDKEGNPAYEKRLSRKRYLSESKGKQVSNIWTDIENQLGDESTGYRTQKPLALLRRIIEASTSEGDVVLDPFCGCATTCLAADDMGREWAGIDVSPEAAKVIKDRMKKAGGLFGDIEVVTKADMRRFARTDLGKLKTPGCKANREQLYGEQGGHCAGCGGHFEMRNMDVDHIQARSRGGQDHIDNLQLLCCGCNRKKGNRDMGWLVKELGLAG